MASLSRAGGFEAFFAELADCEGTPESDPERFQATCERYGLEMAMSSVPELHSDSAYGSTDRKLRPRRARCRHKGGSRVQLSRVQIP